MIEFGLALRSFDHDIENGYTGLAHEDCVAI